MQSDKESSFFLHPHQKRYLPEIYGKPIYPLLKPWSKKEESRKLCVPTTVSKVSHVVVVIVYCTIFSVRNGDLMDLSYPTAVQLVILSFQKHCPFFTFT